MPNKEQAAQNDTTAEIQQPIADASIQQAAPEEEAKATDEALPASSETAIQAKTTPSFCIVLASQVSRVNAEDFVKRLKKAGYSHARVCEHHSIRRVVYGYYESQTEAVNELRSIRGSKFFEEAWVMEIKE